MFSDPIFEEALLASSFFLPLLILRAGESPGRFGASSPLPGRNPNQTECSLLNRATQLASI
jgi:hypothetical protein